ncbi:DUF882 domain-containing protein [Shewanella corallii]|uniref:Murein endopeptidase K n=1 Tax=Shewanella corallii TaxID=560080 RepID=A0ABT0NAE2_9GAMM|nr:DUF882 domain-containing protein [Shewanella corallii]MCL2914836.1 DUF882 domain-containing protein [Shewanella corallii]
MQSVCPSRRMALKLLGSAALCSVIPGQAYASRSTKGSRFLDMVNLHTGDRFEGDFWHDGSYQQAALDGFNYVLRDHRQNIVAPMDLRVFDILFNLQQKLGKTGEIEIISGYRSPHTNAMLASKSGGVAKKSYHMKGMAVDLRMPGVKLADLRDAAKSLKAGGVGFYPRSDFIHVDCGPVRYW